MKPNLALLLLLLPLSSHLAAATPSPLPETAEQTEEQSPAAILAAQVREIAASDTMSRKTQAKLITNAVRLAAIAATEGIKDPAARLKAASDLAAVATKAAPHFAATIISAVSEVPAVSGIDGALEEIQSAVSTALDSDGETSIANPAVNPPRARANVEFGGPNQSETVVSPSH